MRKMTLMVRRRDSAVSNHEATGTSRASSFETRRSATLLRTRG